MKGILYIISAQRFSLLIICKNFVSLFRNENSSNTLWQLSVTLFDDGNPVSEKVVVPKHSTNSVFQKLSYFFIVNYNTFLATFSYAD